MTSIKLSDWPLQGLGGSPRLATRGTRSWTIEGLALGWPAELAVYWRWCGWEVVGSMVRQSPSGCG